MRIAHIVQEILENVFVKDIAKIVIKYVGLRVCAQCKRVFSKRHKIYHCALHSIENTGNIPKYRKRFFLLGKSIKNREKCSFIFICGTCNSRNHSFFYNSNGYDEFASCWSKTFKNFCDVVRLLQSIDPSP